MEPVTRFCLRVSSPRYTPRGWYIFAVVVVVVLGVLLLLWRSGGLPKTFSVSVFLFEKVMLWGVWVGEAGSRERPLVFCRGCWFTKAHSSSYLGK